MTVSRRSRRLVLVFGGFPLLAWLGRPAWHLALVWLCDPSGSLPPPAAGGFDASRLDRPPLLQVVTVESEPAAAERQIADLIRQASHEGRNIAICGANHSMGGHTVSPDATVLDMGRFRTLSLDPDRTVLTAGAGARWNEIIPFLDSQGLSVPVMQSNNDFSVGGSVSVNCHGWQHAAAPISGTVVSFRLATADGSILTCDRRRNSELFSLALGGYGLFGVILDIRLRVVPNCYYQAEKHAVPIAGYASLYRRLTTAKPYPGMAYGRLCIAPDSFLDGAILTLLREAPTSLSVSGTLENTRPSALNRLVFRGEVGSDYGKNLRWSYESKYGETSDRLLSRNALLNDPSSWFANRDHDSTDVLHEYFVPVDRLGEFVARIKPILLERRPDLLNITIRNVQPDTDTFLNYAREEVFGLVMLFHQGRDEASETAMRDLTRELVREALASGGTYYLPYRPHPTREQFAASYPQSQRFFELKRHYDPSGVFQNRFLLNYGPAEKSQ